MINVHHREPHVHNPEEVSLLVFIGEQMGGVVSKSLLEEEAGLQEEAAVFKRQLEERKLVELQESSRDSNTTEEDAYFRLRIRAADCGAPCAIWQKRSFWRKILAANPTAS